MSVGRYISNGSSFQYKYIYIVHFADFIAWKNFQNVVFLPGPVDGGGASRNRKKESFKMKYQFIQ